MIHRRWNNTNAPLNVIFDYLKFYLVALLIVVCLLYWGFTSSEKNSGKEFEDENELRAMKTDYHDDEKYSTGYFSGDYISYFKIK